MLRETLPTPTAAAQLTLQQAQRLRVPPGFTAGPKLPKPGPIQADNGAAHQRPALYASLQRQPAQASAATHQWPPLQASTRLEPEHMQEGPELTAVGASQQHQDHEALLKGLLLQPKASSSTTEQHTVHVLHKVLPKSVN